MINNNISILENLVGKDDEFGKQYIELIKSAIEDGRACGKKFSIAKSSYYKKSFFKKQNKDYIYCEVHHIVPKCCGGSDDADNLVYLYCTECCPEHLKAHEYLWKSSSLFLEFHNQLAGSFFKMTHSRKISSSLTLEEAARLREEYGKWKHDNNKGVFGRNKKANKIIYNGIEYPSSNSLLDIEIDGSKHDRHTILDWARHGLHGLSLVSGEVLPLPIKEKKPVVGIEIIFNGVVYPSARSLKGVELEDGVVLQQHSSILFAARKGLHGLQIKDPNYLKGPERPKKIKMTREERILANSRSVQIEYDGVCYPSARSLEKVIMVDGKYHSKGTILSWAKQNKNGLSLYEEV